MYRGVKSTPPGPQVGLKHAEIRKNNLYLKQEAFFNLMAPEFCVDQLMTKEGPKRMGEERLLLL